MNKLLTTILSLLTASTYCYAQHTVEIKGKIDGVKSGKLVLLRHRSENKIDTLGTTPFSTPDFALSASLAEPSVVRLVVAGYAGGFEFIAEPGAQYLALLKDGDGAYIKGGDLQDKWLHFQSWMKASQDSIDIVKKRYDALLAQNKYRSASRTNDTLIYLQKQQLEEQENFLKGNDNIISAYMAQSTAVAKGLSLEDSERLYVTLGPSARSSISGRIMKERIDRLKKTSTGQKAPDFTMSAPDGKQYTISKVPGKIKIVDFWASWCGPCRLNNRTLKELYATYHTQGLEIIGVSMDDNRDKWIDAIEKDQLPWINISDLKAWKSEVSKLYDITGIPALFILDEKNNIIGRNIKGEALKTFINKQFNR